MPEFPNISQPAPATSNFTPENPVGPGPDDKPVEPAVKPPSLDDFASDPDQPPARMSMAPKMADSDNLSSTFTTRRDRLSGDAAEEELEQEFGGGTAKDAQSAPDTAAPVSTGAKALGKGKSMFLDMARGVAEAPSQIAGGVRDGIQNSMDLLNDFGKWADEKMPGLKLEDFSFKGVKPFAQHELPEVHGATSTTGSLVRGAAQFITGFETGGRLVSGTGLLANLAKGSIASFQAFNGHDKRLSDLVQEYPALQNPVTDFLSSKPGDSEATGRLKNALEGLGMGVVTEGFVKAIGVIKGGRVLEAAHNAMAAVDGEGPAVAQEVTAADFKVLGDPEKQGTILSRTQTAMEEGLTATGDMTPSDVQGRAKAGPEKYINFAKIDTPDDVKTVMRKMANSQKGDIDAASRGVRSWEDTKLSSEQENAWNTLVNRRDGDPLNAEQSLAARNLWAASGEKLKETAKLAANATNDTNMFMFRKQLMTHYFIQREVLAARTETARALNQWKIPAGSSKEMAGQMQAILEANGGGAVTKDMATKIAMLADADMAHGMETMVNGGAWAKTKDMVSQLWINSLLSNPATHVANSISNFASAAQQVLDRKAAEYISQTLGTDGGVEIGEAASMAHAGLSGLYDGLRALVKKTAGHEVEPGPWEKSEQPRIGAFSSEKLGMSSTTWQGRALDTFDHATNTPGRMLTEADQVFKSIGYRMELQAQAHRLAMQDVRAGQVAPEALKERISEILANPPSDVRLEAVNAATYSTFTGKPAEALSKLGQAFQNLPLGRMFLPFKNTPINILTYATEHTPMAPLVKTWRADFMAGGARRDVALARVSTGSMVMSLAMDQALNGTFTGKGPQEPGQRAEWMRAGNQPYSFKVGNRWVAYNRVDPIGMTIGLAADISESVVNAQKDVDNEHFEKAMTGAIFAVANNAMSKTYLQGMADLMAAITNNEMKGESFVQKLTGSLVPAGVASMARNGLPGVGGDPYMRIADNMVDSLRRRIPGLSKDLPLYRDLWGREVNYQSGNGWAYDMFSPIYMKTAKPEPVDKELERLTFFPQMPDKKMTIKGVKVELTPPQFSRFMQLSGNEGKLPQWGLGAKDFLNQVVKGDHPLSPLYDMKSDGPDGGKSQFIRFWLDKYRDNAKNVLFDEDKALQATWQEKKAQKPGRLRPDITGGM